MCGGMKHYERVREDRLMATGSSRVRLLAAERVT
jgi:hypothetical protein